MTDKEVMQMALDVLESLQAWPETPENFNRVQAIEALRAALAQPEPAECDGGQCGIGGYCKQCPKTQPEQEPVAWISNSSARMIHWSRDAPAYGEDWKPLYTAPPQREWQGLTDEEIEQIVNTHWNDPSMFIEAIEAKLKEKNHDS